MKEMVKILQSLGYRKLGEDLYAKPIAYNLFTFNIKHLVFKNVVKGINGDILIWNSELYETRFEKIDFREFIKYSESYSHIESSLKSNFEFLTQIELLNDII